MKNSETRIIDANEAAADVAYRLSEVVSIYPITPASPMGEHADAWAATGRPNLWGSVPRVVEMQSEGGAAGAVHGALQAGALTTTFTASQGLLLMLPNLYKIAGELTPMVLHVAARSLATHALSIFGDHSDVMAARQTGMAMLCSNNAQEAHDFAVIAQAASLESRIPFLHFFDGFRTSHELAVVRELSDDDLAALIDESRILEHRARALTPDRPVVRGTAQNPDAFFQAREAINPFYDACPEIVERAMDAFAARTGRRYRPFEYVGHPEAEEVLVLMGSGAETVHETVEHMVAEGRRVGVVKVRLYRPWSTKHLLAALPRTTRRIAVLDRTKEPGATGEPLYLDMLAALAERPDAFAQAPRVVGGIYGLSSKEFGPREVKAVVDNLASAEPRNHFTVGIVDDVTRRSLPLDDDYDIEPADVVRAMFFGLGSDGTVSANKNSIKIIGEEAGLVAQGYFVYDSKKAGAVTVSHLRFGPRPIRSTYLIRRASFVACHQWSFLDRYEVLEQAAPGATFLLNSAFGPEEVWGHLPREVQRQIREKRLSFWVVDAHGIAQRSGLGRRINTIMQTCFFALSGVLPRETAIEKIQAKIRETYSPKGEELVRINLEAVDAALEHLRRVEVPAEGPEGHARPSTVDASAPDFVKNVTAVLLAGEGDRLPVSAFAPDGTWPTATSQWAKYGIGQEIPAWDPKVCIQCNKCAAICPHAAIRVKAYEPSHLDAAPEGFQATDLRGKDLPGMKYTVQVAPDDCTGCGLCVAYCPAKDKSNPRHKAIDMEPAAPLREQEREKYSFFLDLPDPPREQVPDNLKGSQLLRPLFEYSGACAGCGETPYVKLLTQLFGDRLLIANATGCSSIYGGNLPTTPYSVDDAGRGPAWSNSLFEDNAEFGLGFRLAVDQQRALARQLLASLAPQVGEELARTILEADHEGEQAIAAQRERVEQLRTVLAGMDGPEAKRLSAVVDYLVDKSVWIVGGDGWAYDIGYGGLDHVLASGADVNILVLDTEVYSNTGGQSSKATPLGAVAKFAAEGKRTPKKDLALLAMMHPGVYVARVALGAKDLQTYRALREAESWKGPSIVIAYSHCIAHGYDLSHGAEHQKLAVDTGYWPLLRYDPRRLLEGQPPLVMDSPAPTRPLQDLMQNETRFRILMKLNPERAAALADQAQTDVKQHYEMLERLARADAPAAEE